MAPTHLALTLVLVYYVSFVLTILTSCLHVHTVWGVVSPFLWGVVSPFLLPCIVSLLPLLVFFFDGFIAICLLLLVSSHYGPVLTFCCIGVLLCGFGVVPLVLVMSSAAWFDPKIQKIPTWVPQLTPCLLALKVLKLLSL